MAGNRTLALLRTGQNPLLKQKWGTLHDFAHHPWASSPEAAERLKPLELNTIHFQNKVKDFFFTVRKHPLRTSIFIQHPIMTIDFFSFFFSLIICPDCGTYKMSLSLSSLSSPPPLLPLPVSCETAGPVLYRGSYHQSLSRLDKWSEESIKDTRHDVQIMMEDMLFNS